MNNAVIRTGRLADADQLFLLVDQFATSYRPDRGAFDLHLPQLLAADNVELIVSEVADEVVGYALAFRLLTLFANGAIVELQELMVGPAHRKRGIGRGLVLEVLARAERRGAVEVTVATRRAREFYLGLGFDETATYLKRKIGGAALSR